MERPDRQVRPQGPAPPTTTLMQPNIVESFNQTKVATTISVGGEETADLPFDNCSPASHLRSRERRGRDARAVCQKRRCASAPRTAAAGGSPRHPRGAPASAQLAVHCRRPARLRSTTPRLCGICAAALVARRRSPAR
eukprot:scaffold81158_cov32-Phaeocystis_antarctica.AAC.1